MKPAATLATLRMAALWLSASFSGVLTLLPRAANAATDAQADAFLTRAPGPWHADAELGVGAASGLEGVTWPTVAVSIGASYEWLRVGAFLAATTDIMWSSLELYALEAGPVVDLGVYRLALFAGAGWQRHCDPNCSFPGFGDSVLSGQARLGVGRAFQTHHSRSATVTLFVWVLGVHAPARGNAAEPDAEWSRNRTGGLVSLGVQLPL